MRAKFFIILLIGIAITCASSSVIGQARDFFTDEEVELVRDAQDIDLRILVLTHAIDRRFGVLKIGAATVDKTQKESEKWGPLPKGSRLELLGDIRRILQKAIDDIDDTAAHRGTKMEREPENPVKSKKNDKGEPPFNRAIRLLAAAAQKYKPALNLELSNTKDQRELGTIQATIEFCDQIIEAAANPVPATKPT